MDINNIGEFHILNDPAQFRNALMQTACAYMDFFEYSSALMEIEERYDESLELYDFSTWISSGLSVDSDTDSLEDVNAGEEQSFGATPFTVEAMEDLNCATASFLDICNRTRKACESQLTFLLNLPLAFQEQALGVHLDIPKDKIKLFINVFFTVLEDKWLPLTPEDIDKMMVSGEIHVVDVFKSQDMKIAKFINCLSSDDVMDLTMTATPNQLKKMGVDVVEVYEMTCPDCGQTIKFSDIDVDEDNCVQCAECGNDVNTALPRLLDCSMTDKLDSMDYDMAVEYIKDYGFICRGTQRDEDKTNTAHFVDITEYVLCGDDGKDIQTAAYTEFLKHNADPEKPMEVVHACWTIHTLD